MLYIPPTSKDIYVSSKVALNIHSPDDTGDWHSSGYLDNDRDDRQELFILSLLSYFVTETAHLNCPKI